jgi:hypothetical protein
MRTKLLKKLRKQFLSKYYIVRHNEYYKIMCDKNNRTYSLFVYPTLPAAKDEVRKLVRLDILVYVSEYRKLKIEYLW